MDQTGPRRAFSYLRISTPEQSRGHGVQRQLEASRAYAEKHGLDLQEGDQLKDLGISAFRGANLTEGVLGRFLDAARAGKVEPGSTLIIESLDRLSRQAVRKSLSLFLAIIDSGITIATLADGRTYAPDKTETVELITSLVILSRANEESTTKSQRVSAAWANKRRQAGTKPLTAICPAWLRLSGDRTRYKVIEDRAALVRRIFEESASGIGNYSILRRLNEARIPHFGKSDGWHFSYIAKILKNRAAIGEFQPHRLIDGVRRPDGDPIRNYFPAVVDEELFYRAQLGLSRRRSGGAGRRGAFVSNLFSKLGPTCAYCRSRMKFENKGPPPKGATFLVCEGARRGLSCKIARWRYDHFEASFLAFVRELDLEQVVRGEDEARKRSAMEEKLVALRGELASVGAQMDRTYELLNASGVAATYVAGRLDELAARRVAIESELLARETERTLAGSAVSQLYESRDQLKALIEQLQGREGDETYRLRSQIASRLSSLVTTILVAPAGHSPATARTIEYLRREHASTSADVVAHLEERARDEREGRRYFAVGFIDGTVRAVYPSRDDPMVFEEQLVSTPDEGLVLMTPEHEDQVFPPTLVDDP
jgi:DNA invertase Pin-like site-specific DNA recombinase